MSDFVSKVDPDRFETPATREEVWDLFLEQVNINLTLTKMLLKIRDGKADQMHDEIKELFDRTSKLIETRDKLLEFPEPEDDE